MLNVSVRGVFLFCFHGYGVSVCHRDVCTASYPYDVIVPVGNAKPTFATGEAGKFAN